MNKFPSSHIIERISLLLLKRLTLPEKQAISKQFGECTLEIIKAEVAYVLLEKKERLKEQQSNFSFLYTVVRNYFQDKFLKSKIKHTLREHSLTEETEIGYYHSAITLLFIEEVIETIKKRLSDVELETLCWMIFNKKYSNENNPFLSRISKEAKYKRWGRLKSKLAKILNECGSLDEKEFLLFCELYMSIICKKLRFKG